MADNLFYVQDTNHNLVSAKFLVYESNYVIDPNVDRAENPEGMKSLDGQTLTNPNHYLIVPADYDVEDAIAYASQIRGMITQGGPIPTTEGTTAAKQKMAQDFRSGNPQDLQTSYNGSSNQTFVRAFTSAASWNLGLVASNVGIPALVTVQQGGNYNATKQKNDPNLHLNTTGLFGNDPHNVKSIYSAYDFANKYLSDQGSPFQITGTTTFGYSNPNQDGEPLKVEISYQSGNTISYSSTDETGAGQGLIFTRDSLGKLQEVDSFRINLNSTGPILTPTQIETILDGNASKDPTTLDINKWYVQSTGDTLKDIAGQSGSDQTGLLQANSGINIDTPLSQGTEINLPGVNNSSSPTINVIPNPQPRIDIPDENDAGNSVQQGYVDNRTTYSIGYSSTFLNNTDQTSTTEASFASGGTRPGEIQSDPNPFLGKYYGDIMNLSDGSVSEGMITSNLAAGSQDLSSIDPILLDLGGQGVQTTSEASNPVFFDSDHSGVLKQTAWTPDGNTGILVVPDTNGNVTNISQVMSEYFGGTQVQEGAKAQNPISTA
jgi:hypothetical protein